MKAIIMKIGKPKVARLGGTYIRVIFRGLDDNKSYRLDVYDNHSASIKWKPYLKEQAVFDRVQIFKDNIIDGTSNFLYLGLRHPEKK